MSGPANDKRDPRVTAARSDLADGLLRGDVEADRFVDGVSMRVAVATVGLRARPEPASSRIATLLMGEPVRVFEINDGWAWVQSAVDDYVGYAPADKFAQGWLEEETASRVGVLRTHIYPEPDMKTQPLDWAPLGARLALSLEIGGAGFQRLETGGWAFTKHLATTPALDWVAVAEGFLGTPYLWGGESAEGVDCSGLIQVSLEASGRAAPRDSDMQETALGHALEPGAALERGDLIFWKGHIGVMVDSETMLHATAWAMMTIYEKLHDAIARIEAAGGGAPTSMRRI